MVASRWTSPESASGYRIDRRAQIGCSMLRCRRTEARKTACSLRESRRQSNGPGGSAPFASNPRVWELFGSHRRGLLLQLPVLCPGAIAVNSTQVGVKALSHRPCDLIKPRDRRRYKGRGARVFDAAKHLAIPRMVVRTYTDQERLFPFPGEHRCLS